MSTLGDDLIAAMTQAIEMQRGEQIGRIHRFAPPREVRKKAKLTQAQIAPLLGMSLSGYRKLEQGQRPVQGPAAVLLRVLDREPAAFKRALSLGE